MAKEDISILYKQDLEYNAANPMFTDKDDEMLGERKNGYYAKIDDNNGRKFLCHTFDNGHCFYMNPNTKKLMQFTQLSPDLFLHKYVETFMINFIKSNNLEVDAEADVQFEEVTFGKGDQPNLKVVLDRDEDSLTVSAISVGSTELAMKLIDGIYRLCKFCSFPMFVDSPATELAAKLHAAGAEPVDGEENVYEITENTKFV